MMARLAPPFSIFRQSHYWRPLLSSHNAKRTLTAATNFSITSLARTPKSRDEGTTTIVKLSSKARRKAFYESPEGVLLRKLNECSKDGNVAQALCHYDEARKLGVLLNLDHYNKLLYLCSIESAAGFPNLGLKRGFEVFQQMLNDRVQPNEATFTNAARLAAANEDPDMAFELLKQMKNVAIAPKLRSYEPALFGFCKRGDAEKAYLVDADMVESGIVAEEPELSALLEVSVNAKKEDKVYDILHRLRSTLRQVSESTLGIVEDWFNSEYAAKIGKEKWDVKKVREGIAQGGGGWHGQGWLGSGRWKVANTQVNEDGVCPLCGEKLVSIDIDPKETENFAASLSKLACQKEAKANFVHFQTWLEQHGPFDAVVDGANVGLANGHNFSFSQLNTVVEQLRQISPSKRLPLIILHISRVRGGPAQNPKNMRLIENWKKKRCSLCYTSRYWLYAAVSCKCLLLTNDEMRDHLFQLLGSNFFPRWKEKHQVRTSASTCGHSIIMPPRYSIVIQESANGSWHVPTVTTDDHEIPRKWLCATRSRKDSLHNLWTSSSKSDCT
ncbi:Proteinaceous RNase P 1, chloroplastic/mitochondrial [Glycine max]|nr:Proteinaceous RNase P 1, chloroplastic/mitochondrial [Glycine max]KAH1212184.1 Proteinaceous RNase P 1, chloroplastic/mitochondrial [Glycine max]